MKGIILAAGDGGRLSSITLETPKVLLEIAGRPLIHYSLNALNSAGIRNIAVVVGYQAEMVVESLGETYPYLTFVNNEHYDGGNAISLFAARTFALDEPFVICMGDHPISRRITRHLLSMHGEGCVLCVDPDASHPSQVNDATRVLVDTDGHISAIGKHLRVWNATDTGVFRMTRDVFPVIESLMEKQGTGVSITDVVNFMGESGRPFATCDISGMLWADVDTPEDYRSVDSLLRGTHGDHI